MASTYVNDLRLDEMATGDGSGTWGTTTNTNLELIGEAMGYGTEAVADSSTDTITMVNGSTDGFRCTFLRLTGGGQACTVTLAPNTVSHTWVVRNTTGYALTLSQGSGANVIIAAGQAKIISTDGLGGGAVVYECLEDLELGGTLTVGIDDTGQDVKFFGATSGNYMLWDESADSLLVSGDIDMVTNGNRIDLDTDNDTSIRASADDTITIEVGGSDLIALTTTSTFSCPVTVGVDDTGHDVKLFGATSGKSLLWDESADSLIVTGSTSQQGTLTVGVDDTGYDVKLFGATSGKYWLWDESADGVVQYSTLTVGVDDTGYDVKFFGATASAYMLWDESADDLILAGAARVVVPASGLVIGSTAVSSTAAELNLLDGLDRGSILYGNSSSATTVLGQGSADQVLTSDGTDISWEDASGGGATDLDGLSDCKSGGTDFTSSLILGHQTTGTLDAAVDNTAVGYAAMDAITSGDNNTCIGSDAGTETTTGSNNTFIGFEAGKTVATGGLNTCIGEIVNTTTEDAGSRIGLGAQLTLTANNYVKIGVGGNNVSTTFAGGSAWSWTSDERLKHNITTDTLGLTFIDSLRPVTFNFKRSQDIDPSLTEHYHPNENRNDSTTLFHGMIAQEVKEALDAVGVDSFGGWSLDPIDDVQLLSPSMFVYPLIKAVKELSAKNDALEARIEALES